MLSMRSFCVVSFGYFLRLLGWVLRCGGAEPKILDIRSGRPMLCSVRVICLRYSGSYQKKNMR